MEIVKEHFHPSFWKGDSVKSVFEFELPKDSFEHHCALNGHKFLGIILAMIDKKHNICREYAGTPEAEEASRDILFLEEKAREMEVFLYKS